ncbi:MAG TPA: hypothetical protein PKA63_09815 [Oligoflexia bacterium]|nr:hypothetical protein [Oligoflexia bacterium]HMP48951.1 hypothetical protein [Oligoflexia bacterium]
MRKITLIIVITLFPILSKGKLFAEDQISDQDNTGIGIFLCNGVWVNESCNSDNSQDKKPKIPSTSKTKDHEKTEKAKRNRDIEEILHPLVIKRNNLKREFQAEYSIRALELLCFNELTSLSDCADEASNEQDKLLKYEIQLRELALKEKNPKRENEETTTGAHSTTVIINQPVIPLIRRPYYGRPPRSPAYPSRPPISQSPGTNTQTPPQNQTNNKPVIGHDTIIPSQIRR